jgi:hypothetical protein
LRCGPIAFLSAGLALNTALAQPVPTEFLRCTPDCREVQPLGVILDCGVWYSNEGRTWWGPLRNAGPIQVSVEAYQFGAGVEPLPLFAQIREPVGASLCSRPFPGTLIWQTYGRDTCDPDSMWSTSPVIDISGFLPLGETYYFQLEGFLSIPPDTSSTGLKWSPAVRCVRVRSFPVSVLASSWGHVKSLFR